MFAYHNLLVPSFPHVIISSCHHLLMSSFDHAIILLMQSFAHVSVRVWFSHNWVVASYWHVAASLAADHIRDAAKHAKQQAGYRVPGTVHVGGCIGTMHCEWALVVGFD
jgi:hypothetical protein